MQIDGIFQLNGLILYEVILAFFVGAYLPMEKYKKGYLFLALIPMSIMIMFHSPAVGNDSMVYWRFFTTIQKQSIQGVMENTRFEHGYLLFNWIVGRFTTNPQWIIIGVFIIASAGWWINKYVEAPGLFFVLLVEVLMIDSWISVSRQTIVIGLLFFAFDFAINKKIVPFILVVLFASTFHNVALIFFITYPLINIRGGYYCQRKRMFFLRDQNSYWCSCS